MDRATGSASTLVGLQPDKPWVKSHSVPHLELYEPQIAWTDEWVNPACLEAQAVNAIQELVVGVGQIEDHEAITISAMDDPYAMASEILDGLIEHRRDTRYMDTLGQLCTAEVQEACCFGSPQRKSPYKRNAMIAAAVGLVAMAGGLCFPKGEAYCEAFACVEERDVRRKQKVA